jgi:hypothetical protein
MLAATHPWTAVPHPVDPTSASFRRERYYISVFGDTHVCGVCVCVVVCVCVCV